MATAPPPCGFPQVQILVDIGSCGEENWPQHLRHLHQQAAHSSQLKHQLTDLTGAHVHLSYTHEKLSAEDDAQEEDYLVNLIFSHRPKPGSRDPKTLSSRLGGESPSVIPSTTNENQRRVLLTVYKKSPSNYCRSPGLLPKITKLLLAS